MSEYTLGSEKTFEAVLPVGNDGIEAAVQGASNLADQKQFHWCSMATMVGAVFLFRSGYELFEEHGKGWFVRFSQSVRVYTLEESTTLPGNWMTQGDVDA